jgi:hypothetical protein
MGPITAFDRVAERVVQWCLARPTPIPHAANKDLLR